MEDIGNVCIDLTVDPYIAYVALACDYSSLRSCLHLFLCPSSRPFRGPLLPPYYSACLCFSESVQGPRSQMNRLKVYGYARSCYQHSPFSLARCDMWAMYTVGLHLIATCWTQGHAHDSGMWQEAHYDGSAANRDTLHSWSSASSHLDTSVFVVRAQLAESS